MHLKPLPCALDIKRLFLCRQIRNKVPGDPEVTAPSWTPDLRPVSKRMKELSVSRAD